ncbi:hypothetical protein GCK72_018442 [Caenorhabditis remanei]|uniref:Glycosyltransferase family 92 protein n=1 Tax=Caenorhabditis remanei TaxID=31234 RepID=A0A6A5G9T4_CAERE|nr:hypothetical protein GCK72_018442 [Caenorhabditis remanei]KAF1751888.1 hypothetical protein GCK72_018442 [Caenorhabditis remanei]
MRLLCRRPKKITVLVLLVILFVWSFITIIEFSFGLTVTHDLIAPTTSLLKSRELKAFITSAYYYPTSKSLGNNAIALVMSINLVKGPISQMETVLAPNPTELVIMAKNETSSIIVSAPYHRVTPHEVCQIITIFATVQLLPNVKSISMVGDNGMTEIPFTIPSYTKRDVVVCTSPLFVSEQWQNFLFAVHIYRKFGAHMNLYLISSVNSFYELMKEYEREESARFVTFLDLDDVLIPKLAPTYAEEFQKLMEGKKRLAYIFYHKENYDAITVRDSSKFSLKKMFSSLECKHKRETGKIVVDPRNLNYTWIHFPPILPNGLEKYEVTENVITHLKTIIWSDDQDPSSKILIEPPYFDNSSATLISSKAILDIEDDLRKMMRKPRIRKIFPKLPNIHYFTDLVVKCYNDRYYRYHYSGRIGEIKCPGPQLCGFHQHPKIKCTHVNATHNSMEKLSPITYYYATDPHFTEEIGCYSH